MYFLQKKESISLKYVFRAKSKYFLVLASLLNLWITKTFKLFFYKWSKIKLILKTECWSQEKGHFPMSEQA